MMNPTAQSSLGVIKLSARNTYATLAGCSHFAFKAIVEMSRFTSCRHGRWPSASRSSPARLTACLTCNDGAICAAAAACVLYIYQSCVKCRVAAAGVSETGHMLTSSDRLGCVCAALGSAGFILLLLFATFAPCCCVLC